MPGARSTAVLLFASARYERNKRLGLDPSSARSVADGLFLQAIDVLSTLPRDVPVVIASEETPPARALRMLGARAVAVVTQEGNGFEARFLGAVDRALALGFERIVAIGSDTPGLEASDLTAAIDSPLDRMVVGPAADGGAYLIALDRSARSILDGLPWCTPSLTRTLIARAGRAGHAVRTLAVRSDIDRRTDVRRLRPTLEAIVRRFFGAPAAPARPSPAVDARTTAQPPPPGLPLGRASPRPPPL